MGSDTWNPSPSNSLQSWFLVIFFFFGSILDNSDPFPLSSGIVFFLIVSDNCHMLLWNWTQERQQLLSESQSTLGWHNCSAALKWIIQVPVSILVDHTFRKYPHCRFITGHYSDVTWARWVHQTSKYPEVWFDRTCWSKPDPILATHQTQRLHQQSQRTPLCLEFWAYSGSWLIQAISTDA